MRQWKAKISTLLCLVLILPLLWYQQSVHASNLTNDTIKKKEGEISQAQKEKQSLQSGLTDVKKIMQELEKSKSDLKQYVTQLDSSLNSIEKKLEELNTMVEKKIKEIEETKKKLVKAEADAKEQYESMKSRIKFMYEKGDSYYIEMMLSAKSFGEFLNKAEYINKLSEYDRKMLTKFQETEAAIAKFKVELEEEQAQLEEAKKSAEAEQKSMESLISAKEQQIGVYESDISNKSQIVKEYEAEIAAQNAAIAAMEKAVAEEKKRLAAANSSVQKYDGGKFAWPAPSYSRISDNYGNRMHPTLGVQQFHNGVDLASPGGSPILAAYDGTVVQAAYSNTMGNYIMLDHGDGLYTIYMHSSALYVSAGTTVTRGQKIAAVGSTGRSTGNHLHFSVRLNGSYVSPWNYISS